MINNQKDKFLIVLLSFLIVSLTLFSQKNKETDEVVVMDFSQLKPLLNLNNDTVYVFNFWATWCAPCVNEIPYFEALSQKYKYENVKVLMISLDFPNQMESRLIPFIKEKNMQNEIILLNDPDANRWIPQIDDDWTGAIPATLIYRQNKKLFFSKELTFESLSEAVEQLLIDEE